MNVFDLAKAALHIAQIMGAAEEWDEPDQMLEGIAQTLRDTGGVPDVGTAANQPYWAHMSVDDTLDQILTAMEHAAPAPAPRHDLSVHIDASLASPETITAIFDGLQRLVRTESGVREVTPGDPYGRSADE